MYDKHTHKTRKRTLMKLDGPVSSDPKFTTTDEAITALAILIRDILDSGMVIEGINPSLVRITLPESYRERAARMPSKASGDRGHPAPAEPSGVHYAAPAGWHGDVSRCCGAPLVHKGTCMYCEACGDSNGCS